MCRFRRAALVAVLAACAVVPLGAAVFGMVRGVVHDPQHRPVPGATVTLQARTSAWQQVEVSDSSGSFTFTAVPVGDYTITVALDGFTTVRQDITVVSGAAPVLHIPLELAGVAQSVTVSARPEPAEVGSMTPTTLVDRADVARTPGADRTNSLAAVTAFVPGAYATHDQLHLRGGHQVTWLVDGVPVPNTNIASNVGPQFDPKDIDYMEVQRGSYSAEYGDRTYGVFNVVPRTGFERDREAEVVASAGSFYQTNDQFSIGSHTRRFAYYASANFNRSDLGLETPVPEVAHDRQAGGGGFTSLVFNVTPSSQLRLVASARGDRYQIPTGPEERAAGIADDEHEADAFVNVSWVRTFRKGILLTVSPFYHYNSANYEGGPRDPTSTVDERSSHYAGAQATLEAAVGRHEVQAGFYGFRQHDDQRFAVTYQERSQPDLAAREQPAGHLEAVFLQDRFRAASWLTLTGGVRQTHFAGGLAENATSPRVGASVPLPRVGWVVRGFYGRFYQAPPLDTASGPLLQFVTRESLGFVPLRGERDEEYQVGITAPIRGWALDVDRFQTNARNFFDHNPVGNSNVFFPLTIAHARIRGLEGTLRSPRTWQRLQVHAAYSFQHAEGRGAVTGGLTDFEPPEDGYFPLDHDQRHTLSAGFSATAAHGVQVGGTLYYGSGFPDDDTGAYLAGHTTVDLSVGKDLTDTLSATLNVLNATNRHVLIDNSLTFGGTHYNNPRELYVEVRYRFHY
ncbi:MAG: TonB-dependent receptor [Betaproteobacteria bacterium]